MRRLTERELSLVRFSVWSLVTFVLSFASGVLCSRWHTTWEVTAMWAFLAGWCVNSGSQFLARQIVRA